MDQHKLRSLVFEKTGVRVDIDDPIFALVALNEAVLAEAVERHVALIDAASQELVRHARHAGGMAGAVARHGDGAARLPEGAPPHSDEAARASGIYLDATNEPLLAEAARAAAHSGGAVAAGVASAGDIASLPAAGAASGGAYVPTPHEWRLLGAAAGVAVLSALLVLAGQALFFKPKPVPAPIVQIQSKTLTPEQSAAIANGEKLARAVQKLDPKTRALLQTELQKP